MFLDPEDEKVVQEMLEMHEEQRRPSIHQHRLDDETLAKFDIFRSFKERSSQADAINASPSTSSAPTTATPLPTEESQYALNDSLTLSSSDLGCEASNDHECKSSWDSKITEQYVYNSSYMSDRSHKMTDQYFHTFQTFSFNNQPAKPVVECFPSKDQLNFWAEVNRSDTDSMRT